MDSVQDLVQYFDELYPVTDAIKKFYEEIIKDVPSPAKVLTIGSNSGSLEFFLAKQGCDVTGIENFSPLLEAAHLKRRSQLLSIRFFTLPEDQIVRYLGKKFYNIINIPDGYICFRQTREEVQQLLLDVRELISDDGIVVIKTFNFEQLIPNSSIDYPMKSGMRSRLFTTLRNDGNTTSVSMKLQVWDDKAFPILKDRQVYPVSREELCEFAKKAGFKNVEFYADYEKRPLESTSMEMVCIMR